MPTHPLARALALAGAVVGGANCSPSGEPPPGSTAPDASAPGPAGIEAGIEATIRALLARQAEAWNEGDLVAFVSDYLDSPRTRFASGGSVRHGSDEVLERYERNYPDAAARGRLTFSDLEVRVLSSEFVLVFGRYTLEREADTPTGLFTLLIEATPGGWKISHDHTSSD